MVNKVYLCDCMEFMRDKPDGFYDLAVVDPPYGIIDYIITGGEKGLKIKQREELKEWDKQPPSEYWVELFRISKNQIVFGANYFTQYLPFSRGWIFWDKCFPDGFNRAKGEFIFTSFNRNAEIVKIDMNGGNVFKGRKIHATQKPIILYVWILKNYAKPGWKILDTHEGSGSHRIACKQLGFYHEGCEINKEKWKKQENRYKQFLSDYSLIDEALNADNTQLEIINV